MKTLIFVIGLLVFSAMLQSQTFPPGGGSGGGGSGTVTSVAIGCGLSGGTITTTGTIASSMAVNAQTGTTYTVLNGDCGKLVSIGNASAVAVTLPQANGSTFIAGWFVFLQNTGAGAVTITPTTSTIDGAATLILSQNQGALIASDGTNYKTYRGMYPTFAANAVVKGGGVGAALIGSGVTIDVNNQIIAPGGFSTGGSPGGPLILSGSTSGFVTIVCPAICGTPTLTPPTTSGTLMLTNTGVQASQLPALTGDATSSAGSAATTVGKINGVSLAGLATGVLCNTTGTGVPSICNAASLPAHASRHQNGGDDEVAAATPGPNVIPKAGSNSKLALGWIPFLNSGPPPGSIYRNIKVDNAASGDVDFYTTPAGYRSAVQSLGCFNSAGTTTAAFPEIKLVDTTYRRLTANASAATLNTNNLSYQLFFEAGESISANLGQAGMNCSGLIIDYLNTVPVRTVKLTTLVNGDNTIYTVPSSVVAVSVAPSFNLNTSGTWTTTGGGTNSTWYLVSSGGTAGTANRATAAATLGGNNSSAPAPFKAGNTGDFVVLNITTPTGVNIAWVNVAEIP